MIKSKDRSGWFGASDVNYIVGNWHTKSFEKWWCEKLGYGGNNFANDAMLAGTHYEHKILDFIKSPEKDKQIYCPNIRLRVNLDGSSADTIYEVKTYKHDNGFKIPLKYKKQVWVQMYATGIKKAYVVAYGLTDSDYKNFFNEIDAQRLELIEIEYNEDFIQNVFLPKISYLSECMKKGVFPSD